MGKFFSSIAVQWSLRRVWELGSLATSTLSFLLGLYAIMPTDHQHTVLALLQGNWGELTLKAAGGLIVWAFVQWRSYRATVKPQVVTPGGQQIDLSRLAPDDQQNVVATAVAAPRRRTIASAVLDGLIEKLNRNR